MNLPKVLAACGLFSASLAAALPDGNAGSPRAVAIAVSTGLLAAAIYLGAPKPEEAKVEPGS